MHAAENKLVSCSLSTMDFINDDSYSSKEISGKSSGIGKIRRKTYRLHTAAPKAKESRPEVEELPKFFIQKSEPVKSNLFQNVFIPKDALKQKLPSYSQKDKTNLEINYEIKNLVTRDASHPKRRKIPFHEVVSSAKSFLKQREKAKKKAKVGILGDLQALEKALPFVDQQLKKDKHAVKPRGTLSFSEKEAKLKEDMEAFRQYMNSKEYTADPLGTITAQLKVRLQSGCL